MTVRSHSRGWPIEWLEKRWVYSDSRKPIVTRPCRRCGQPPTPEGHDACLGHLPNVVSACCGHGIEEPFVILAKEVLNDR